MIILKYLVLITFCSILRASAFIEEAVKQLELEYSDSEEEVNEEGFNFINSKLFSTDVFA